MEGKRMSTKASEGAFLMVARIKRPHPVFMTGDIFVGRVWCGDGESVRGWGWSSRLNKVVGGRYGYVVRYCGWKYPPEKAFRAWKEYKEQGDPPRAWRNLAGFLRIIKWINDIGIADEPPPKLRNEAWLRRLLSELSCGNMPLTSKEAAPSKLTAFQRIKIYGGSAL